MEELRTIHLNARNMSGRVVKFRILDPDEVEVCEANGARSAGPDAEPRQLRKEQIKELLAAMIVSYTETGIKPLMVKVPAALRGRGGPEMAIDGGLPDPEALAAATWTKADATLLSARWKSVFNTKDTEALRMQYQEHHELNHLEVMMLSGKAQPAPTGD